MASKAPKAQSETYMFYILGKILKNWLAIKTHHSGHLGDIKCLELTWW